MGNNVLASRKGPYIDILKYAIISLTIFIYLVYIYKYAINLPRWDDYDTILDFLVNYHKANFSDKISLLFTQQNEHRLFSSHVAYALYYALFGDINFRHLIMLNAVTSILVFISITYFIRKALPKDWYIAAFVLSICFFDLNNFENADFATAGMQTYTLLLLLTSALFFYSLKSRWYIFAGALLQVICIFSSGNGSVGAFLVVLFVCFMKDRYKTIVSASTLIIFAPLYYYHYIPSQKHLSTLSLSKIIPFFLHVAGAHFSQDYGIVCGILLLAVLVIILLIQGKYDVKNGTLQLLCIVGFMLFSMAIIAVFRGNIPVELAYSSRYFIYPHILVAITFTFILINLQGKKLRIPIIIASVLILLYAYRLNFINGSANFEGFRSTLKTTDFFDDDKKKAKEVSDEACKQNIYCIDKHRND